MRWRSWCPAATRNARSLRWLPTSGAGCRMRSSTSTIIIRPTAPFCRRDSRAVVGRETNQGKGHVVRRMFNDVEADVYVLVDGDATYDAASARAMVQARRRAPRHDRRYPRGPRSGGLSARPSAWQPAAHRVCRPRFRAFVHRHVIGIPRVLAAVRKVLSGAFGRL